MIKANFYDVRWLSQTGRKCHTVVVGESDDKEIHLAFPFNAPRQKLTITPIRNKTRIRDLSIRFLQ